MEALPLARCSGGRCISALPPMPSSIPALPPASPDCPLLLPGWLRIELASASLCSLPVTEPPRDEPFFLSVLVHLWYKDFMAAPALGLLSPVYGLYRSILHYLS